MTHVLYIAPMSTPSLRTTRPYPIHKHLHRDVRPTAMHFHCGKPVIRGHGASPPSYSMTVSVTGSVPAILLPLSRTQHNLSHDISVFYFPFTKEYVLTNHRFREDVYSSGIVMYGELVYAPHSPPVFEVYASTMKTVPLALSDLVQILWNKYVEDAHIEPIRIQCKRFYRSMEEAMDVPNVHAFLYISHAQPIHPAIKNYIWFKPS